MHMSVAQTSTKVVQDVLSSSKRPISSQAVLSLCRKQGIKISLLEVLEALNELHEKQEVTFSAGKWLAIQSAFASLANTHSIVSLPNLSPDTQEILKSPELSPFILISSSPVKSKDGSPWAIFRKLLQYYRRCLRAEEGADASAYQNQLNQRFLFLESFGSLLPHPHRPWRHSITLNAEIAPFIASLPPPQSEDALVLGFPIFALHVAKENEPPISVIQPIFHFPVEYTLSGNTLHLYIENPIAEINYRWFNDTFKNKDEQKAFLSACGMVQTLADTEQAFSQEVISMDALLSILHTFLPRLHCEKLQSNAIPKKPLVEPFKTGIYNRAVLMLAKRIRYTARLCKELKHIENMPDFFLDRTALAPIFRQDDAVILTNTLLTHEGIVPEVIALNAEQRHASASLLKNKITLITGPPGTGKSQVVAAGIAGCRLTKQSVLFASRNHKALDAVVSRICDKNERPLIVRGNSKDDPNLKYSFKNALRDMLAATYDPTQKDKLDTILKIVRELLRKRGDYAEIAQQIGNISEKLSLYESSCSDLLQEVTKVIPTITKQDLKKFPRKSWEKINPLIQRVNSGEQNIMLSIYCWLALFDFRRLRSFTTKHSIFSDEPKSFFRQACLCWSRHRDVLEKIYQISLLQQKILPLEIALKKFPPLENLVTAIHAITQKLLELTPVAITLDVDSRLGLPVGSDREEIDSLRHALVALETGLETRSIEREAYDLLEKHIPTVLEAFPCWAITSLSVGSRIPCMPSIFDLVVIDEASQSDIPSAIPLLFRAKRAGIVGDPWQLTHITTLSPSRNTLLWRDLGITVRDMRFSYVGNSLYDLVAGSNTTSPILLAETYRSAVDIAGYSNGLFYGNRLRIGTDLAKLRVPTGTTAGIHWSEVNGDVKSAGQSGCYCQEEIEEIVRLLRILLLENSFKGNIGIVTPFRQQSQRLYDALFTADTEFYHALMAATCHIDTAHGFQGDERDVMYFSLCANAHMPRGSYTFLKETGNIFNVAVSRAKAVLHVVGNRSWAMQCDIPHIKALAMPQLHKKRQNIQESAWHPHESPWEEILFDALVARGFEPRAQFQAGSRRLDMALVDVPRKIYFDIEVDGDCHRDASGYRKTDDIWRDIQLQGMGWHVMRFWVYQLRENLDACVDSIEEKWRHYATF